MFLLSRLFSLLILFIVSQVVQAGLVLSFDKEHVVLNIKEPVTSAKPTSSALSVEIGDDYFSYEENNHKFIYDFKRHRIINIDMVKGTYLDDSLFMDIGFRGYEFQNRLLLGRTLSAASLKDNPMAITLSEHIFSLTAKDHKSGIKSKTDARNVVFSWESKELFEYEKKLVKVKTAYKDGFVRFLRYHLGGHPEILQDLQKLTGIPSKLKIRRYNVQTKIDTLRLLSHKYVPDKLPNLEKFKKEKINGVLAPLLLNNLKFSPALLNSTSKALLSKANAAFSEKRYLDTILSYLEYTLATGEQMPKQFNAQREPIVNDVNVKALLSSISPKSKEQARKAIKILVALRDKSTDRKYVLKIFEANIRSSLGMQKESQQLFHAVLKKNPYITGAWKDLGELYFRNYNSRDAWRCWDTARKLNPRHRLLVSISNFENSLINENPEFF